jgi:glycerol-3-phosphate dehydrogenase (NAD(P)+)
VLTKGSGVVETKTNLERPAQRQPHVVVLGGGSWGTSRVHLRAPGHLAVGALERGRRKTSRNHRNSKYLGNEVELADTLKPPPTSLAANCGVIVMGVPSHGFAASVRTRQGLRPWVPVVSLVRARAGHQFPDVTDCRRCCPDIRLASCRAEYRQGGGRRMRGRGGAGVPDQHLAARLAELFRTRRFQRTPPTTLSVGAGALKNVYAIAVGMGYSLGIGENTRAMVMARAIRG